MGQIEIAVHSGYTNCLCRDCMDIAVSEHTSKPEMCGECYEAECEPNTECSRKPEPPVCMHGHEGTERDPCYECQAIYDEFGEVN